MKIKKSVKKAIIITIVIIFLIAVGILFNYYFFQGEKTGKFESDTMLLKISIDENTASVNNVKIKNTDVKTGHFLIKVKEIQELVFVNESEFDLNAGEEQIIQISFNGSKKPGVYLGEIEIFSEITKKIPVILEIQSKEVLFDSNINLYSQGKDISPGQKLNVEVKVFDLASIGRSTVGLNYLIKSFDGRTIISETEDLIVDEKVSFSKTLNLDKNIEYGNYVMYVAVKYDDSVGTSSMFFKVIKESSTTGSENTLLYVVIVFGFFFLIFLGILVYSFFYRDKLLMELQRQYKKELKTQKEKIYARAKKDRTKLKNYRERREYEKELEKVKKQRLKAIREVHQERMRQIREMRKRGKRDLLEKQVRKWRVIGYRDGYLEAKYRFPKIEEIRSRLQRQLNVLEEARAEGYVSKESYEKGKKRIKREDKKLRIEPKGNIYKQK